MTTSELQDMVRRADAAGDEYARTGLFAHVDEAVRLWAAIVERLPSADCFDALGGALLDRYEAGGPSDDLHASRAAYQESVRQDRDPALLNNLGNCLRICHRDLDEPNALAEALAVLSEAVENISPDDEDRLLCQDNLALALGNLFEVAGNRDDLQRALSLHRDVVAAATPENPETPRFHSNFGACAQESFAQTKDLNHLRLAEKAFASAVEHTHRHAPESKMRLANLASARLDLLEYGEDAIDVDDVIAMAETAVGDDPLTEMDGPRRLCILADALSARYLRSSIETDLERAIDDYQRALQASRNRSTRTMCANNLAQAFMARFDRGGRPKDVEAAVGAAQAAVEEAESLAPMQALVTGTLASTLLARYEVRGDVADLDLAIDASERAVLATPFEGWSRIRRLRNLGAALAHRFDSLGNPSDIHRSIEQFELAAGYAETLQRQPGPDSVAALHDLGVALRDLFQYSGDLDDLDRAVDCLRDALVQTHDGSTLHLQCVVSLARALAARHLHAGNADDLAEAIVLADRLATTAEHEPIRAGFRGDHANLLHQRFERDGRSIDLDTAVSLYERAVRETAQAAPARVKLLNGWGVCLWTRYGHAMRNDDLAAAEKAFREALDLAAPAAPDRPIYLDNLATCLVDRYFADADPAQLTLASDTYGQALATLPDNAPDRPRIEANSSGIPWEQWKATGEPHRLDEVVDINRRVLDRATMGNVGRARWSSNLAMALEDRFAGNGSGNDLKEAIERHRTACVVGLTTDLGWALKSARRWGRAAMSRDAWAEAAEAHGYGQDAARRLFTLQHARGHKEDWLRQAAGLMVDAAVTSLRQGDMAEAVRALEEGRAQMLSEVLARNALDLEAIAAAGHSDLAERYRAAVSKLTWLDGTGR